jgi:hypothetical protein
VKRTIGLILAGMVAVVLFGRATCQRGTPAPKAVEKMQFSDEVYFHNVGITWDGDRYYTVNGGNDGYGKLNIYDEDGEFDDSYTVALDGRSIFYNPDEEMLYVKTFGEDMATVNPEDGESEVELEGIFSEENSSVGFAPDGNYFYEFDDGEITVYDGVFGEEDNTVEINEYYEEEPYNIAIAASDEYFFVWGSERDIFVYTLDGEYVNKVTLPFDGYALSLSWANDLLWVAEDADGSTDGAKGTWHGYEIKGLE